MILQNKYKLHITPSTKPPCTHIAPDTYEHCLPLAMAWFVNYYMYTLYVAWVVVVVVVGVCGILDTPYSELGVTLIAQCVNVNVNVNVNAKLTSHHTSHVTRYALSTGFEESAKVDIGTHCPLRIQGVCRYTVHTQCIRLTYIGYNNYIKY